jgi:hypothetical protein
MSSRDSPAPHRRLRRTRRRRKRRKRRATGGAPREVESPTPVTKGHRSGRGAGARLRAVSGGGRVRRRSADERRGGTGERYDGVL